MEKKINKLISEYKDIYIYGFGTAGKWLSGNLGKNIIGFIDSDIKKVGKIFNGFKVYSLEQAKRIVKKDSLVITTVLDIQDVISKLESLPNDEWVALGNYLKNTKVKNNPIASEDDSYVEYSLKAVESCHKSYFSKNKLFLKSIDIIITERCSLKCKDCSNLMQYYKKPINISSQEILDNFDDLIRNVDHVYEVRLIGGEPFMNKDIYKIIEKISSQEKITKVVVYTNATIPLKKEEIKTLMNPKIVFSITDYGNLSRNTKKVIDFLSANNIPFRDHPPENWTDCGVIFDFKRTLPEMEKLFTDCCGKNLLTLTDGKLYRCPFAANADRLKGIPLDKGNSVSVNAKRNKIKKYTSDIKFIPACNYCMGRSYDAPKIEPAIQTKKPIDFKVYDSNVIK